MIVLITFSWNYINVQIAEQQEINDIENKLLTVADMLIRTPGLPHDWNLTRVEVIGLASEEGVLDEEKVLDFVDMDYSEIKRYLSIGNYEFHFALKNLSRSVIERPGVVQKVAAVFAVNEPANNEMKNILEDFGEWDYYWGNNEDAPTNNASKVFDNGLADDIFDMLLNNLSSYSSIVLEDPVGAEVETAQERQDLRDFVNNGGTYVHIQDQVDILEDTFSLVTDGSGSEAKIVNNDLIVDRYAQVGDIITFQESAPAWSTSGQPYPMKTIAEKNGDPTKCLVCRWEYGDGFIYYFPDLNNSLSERVDELDLPGRVLEKGFYPTDSNIVVPIERNVLFNGLVVKMEFILWR